MARRPFSRMTRPARLRACRAGLTAGAAQRPGPVSKKLTTQTESMTASVATQYEQNARSEMAWSRKRGITASAPTRANTL